MARLDAIVRKAVHAIIFGPPKVGKTEIVGELACHGFKLKYFDYENGSNTLLRSVPKEFHGNIDVFKIPDTKDFPIGIETALKVGKPGIYKICDKHGVIACPACLKDSLSFSIFDNLNLGPMDIVVHDSLTQVSNSAMARMYIKNKLEETEKPGWEEYNPQGIMLEKFLGTIQNAYYNVICITHEGVVELNDNKTKRLVPLCGTQNFSRNTAKYFDEVIYMEMINGEHRAASATGYKLDVLTGSRSRTALEDQTKVDPKAPVIPKGQRPHISLLPIFINQEIIPAKENNES